MRGKLITVEGPEGVGKSTQVRMLREYAERNNLNILFIREPGCTYTGERIRKILLGTSTNDVDTTMWKGGELNLESLDKEMSPLCEAYLYAACRVELINKVILPTLEKGTTVICDRYIDSSVAYQGYGRQLGADCVEKINYIAKEICYPDYTIFLNLSPNKAFKRKGGIDKTDRLELAGESFHLRVYNGFVKEMQKHNNRYINIVPDGDKYDTHKKIKTALKGVLPDIFKGE